MRIHHFNPEHEIAMAHGKANFTPPHAATRLRSGIGWMPALWAEEGDIVLVDEVEYAIKASGKWHGKKANVHFMTFTDLRHMLNMADISTMRLEISPWGWDLPFRHKMLRCGIPASYLPTLQEIDDIRRLAHRGSTLPILQQLVENLPYMVGERHIMTDIESVEAFLTKTRRIVLKSPWSSSGRGVRYVSEKFSDSERRWMNNIILHQGSIIVEPCYTRIMDFALEMEIDSDSNARYLGLSLFETRNGAYTGNWVATEDQKRERMSKYMDISLLEHFIKAVSKSLSSFFSLYQGPLGIDMMIVSGDDGFRIHPCVEINLRRTMGHVALHLSPTATEPDGVLHVIHGVNDELRLDLNKTFVKVIP